MRDVHKLRDFVEGKTSQAPDGARTDGSNRLDRDEFEILKESPMLGDGKYKLEIGSYGYGRMA